MPEAVFEAMGEVLARWTMGAAAAPVGSIWKDKLGADPREAELRLLALSGQFLGVAVTAEPPPDLHMLADVPGLSLPPVPEALRSLVRRVLEASKDPTEIVRVLEFLAARGWTVHPGDWMPAANTEAPDVYAPWRVWAERAAHAPERRSLPGGQLTAETWDDFLPVARKLALDDLRRKDPIAARVLLEAKLAGENADARLKLLNILEIGLSESDAAFLERIAADDRAATVKDRATALLGRIRRTVLTKDDLAELSKFFTVQTKGLLRRSRSIRVETVKAPAQRSRRAELMAAADLDVFARSLGLTETELIASWPWQEDTGATSHFVLMVGRSGTNTLVMQMVEAVCREGGEGRGYIYEALQRLTAQQRSALAAVALSKPNASFDEAAGIGGRTLRLEDPLATLVGAALLGSFQGSDMASSLQANALRTLGLITARPWARRVMERLNAEGVVMGDPRLDMLKLNDALDDNGAEP